VPIDIDASDLAVLLLYNLDLTWEPHEQATVNELARRLEQAMMEAGHPVTTEPVSDPHIGPMLDTHDARVTTVFNWCEGFPGVPHSDCLVARVLEDRGFTFTGADSRTLALSQDKRRVKELLDELAIPTPRWHIFDAPDTAGWDDYPAIVKAANEHTSEGITPESVVMNELELSERVAHVLETYRQPALVEDFIDGREFHVSLWGNGQVEVLPVAEMDFSRFSDQRQRLCTWDSKCVPGSVHYEGIQTILPSALSGEQLEQLEGVSRAAYTAIGCRDYGRIDVRMRDGTFYVLDVNPNADISVDASLACAAEVAGFSYGEFGSRIVRLAARRHPRWAETILSRGAI
jgi:D-alanine-D-alanine ligase